MKKENKKRKKQFYKNKNRNSHWTEEPKGHEIDFADKYIYDGSYSDKYTETKRHAHESKIRKKAKRQKNLKRFITVVLALILISVGYTGMDIYMTRHAVPAENAINSSSSQISISEITLNLQSRKIDSKSLDGSVMLKSIITDTQQNGYNSIVFDAKRVDGTIGYSSTLASIDTYGAISNPSTKTKESISQLIENDILPVARISCYKDNVAPAQNSTMALMQGDKFYTSDDSTYLNPNSENAYTYIRDIIRELNTYGVTVFVLSDINLPEDISDKYDDGFDAITKKLTSDLGDGIKFIEEVNVEITGINPNNGRVTNSAIKKEIQHFDKLKKNQIYYISTKLDSTRVNQRLIEEGTSNYIIGE